MISSIHGIKGYRYIVLALLSLLVCGSVALGVDAGNTLDWKQEATLTVYSSEGAKEYLNELKKTEDRTGILVYDLYKIADVEKKNSGFQYDWLEEYASLETMYEQAISDDSNQKLDWNILAQEAMIKAVGDKGSIVNESARAAYSGLKLEEPHAIEKGLYLLIARGSLPDKTVVESTPVYSADLENPKIESHQLVTHTWLDEYTFTVQPVMICVPTKMSGDKVIAPDTSVDGEWIYDQQITLKMIEDPATGSILINKELNGYYKDMENATFVFQVDTYYPTQDELYSSEVYSMTFDKSGKKSLQIDGLPVGANIKIMEIYSGANFTASIEAPDSLNVVVGKDDVTVAEFTNTYNGNKTGGGGITNHFTFDEEKDWYWEQKADNTITSNGVTDILLQSVMKANEQTSKTEE